MSWQHSPQPERFLPLSVPLAQSAQVRQGGSVQKWQGAKGRWKSFL